MTRKRKTVARKNRKLKELEKKQNLERKDAESMKGGNSTGLLHSNSQSNRINLHEIGAGGE